MTMRRVVRDGSRCELVFRCHDGFPNAVRRALMNDVQTYAPAEVRIRTNTSSQTDEYLAHRIGLIPFVALDEAEAPLTLRVTGRTATARDMQGDSFRAVQDVPLVRLIGEQTVDMDVVFAKGTAAEHARYAPIGPVAYRRADDGTTTLAFETISGTCPLEHGLEALRSLLARIDDTTHAVETQYDVDRKIVS